MNEVPSKVAASGRDPVSQPVPMVQMVRRPSTVDLIAAELRQAIYSGSLRPGTAVREADVSSQLGVSRGPFREGAQRLVAEGLLVPRRGAGLQVVEVGPDQLDDLYQARLALEGFAVRTLATLPQQDRTARLGPLKSLLSAVMEAAQGEDARAIGNADLDLHQGLVEAVENSRLTGFASTLMVQTRLAALSHPGGYVVRRDVEVDYRRLLDQIEAGRPEEAVGTLADHFRQTVERLRGTLEAPVSTVAGTADGTAHSFTPLP